MTLTFVARRMSESPKLSDAGQASNGTVPLLDGNVYTGLTCAYWPSAPIDVVTTESLTAEGVSTFVLNSYPFDPARDTIP